MTKLARGLVKHRVWVIVVCLALIVPSVLGMINTKVKYDLLYYLPGDLDTVKGQEILMDEFGKGSFSLIVTEGMPQKDVAALQKEIEAVPHVANVMGYATFADASIPREILPDNVYKAFNQGDSTLLAVFFDETSSADGTMQAITDIRKLANEKCFVCGLSAVVTDTKNVVDEQEGTYVLIAVALACITLAVCMDSLLLPLIFLFCIGVSVLWNMGSNYFLGEISYVTKAVAAVLQLAVTLDYSIFLWHAYQEQKQKLKDRNEAMAQAIVTTASAIVGSSMTTVAGFVSICFMSFTLGRDLGIVMSKGVLLGVLGSITLLPAVLLSFDRAIERTTHKPLIPEPKALGAWITKRYRWLIVIFVVLLIPAFYGYHNVGKYYDLSNCLPDTMACVKADQKLKTDFGVSANHLLLTDTSVSQGQTREMLTRMEKVQGVKNVIGLETLTGAGIPEEILPDNVRSELESGRYRLTLISSEYAVSSDAVNAQIDTLNGILKEYDQGGMLIGEAPCTKDLISCTDHDFTVVSVISIVAVFLIIALVLRSATLPIILVAIIEFGIFFNLCIPYYTGVSLPFVAPILISTIQLGATVDYAILMTTRYKQARLSGRNGKEAVEYAVTSSGKSILVSGLSFFAATFGVGLYSDVDIISSMCGLISRGALISVIVVLFVLPAILLATDKVICRTTRDMKLVKG